MIFWIAGPVRTIGSMMMNLTLVQLSIYSTFRPVLCFVLCLENPFVFPTEWPRVPGSTDPKHDDNPHRDGARCDGTFGELSRVGNECLGRSREVRNFWKKCLIWSLRIISNSLQFAWRTWVHVLALLISLFFQHSFHCFLIFDASDLFRISKLCWNHQVRRKFEISFEIIGTQF